MKLSTSLLFISWVPLLQLYLINNEGNSIWVFLISIVLAVIGVWCMTKSLPGKPDISVSMPPAVSIMLSAIPIFSGIQELFDIDLNVFTYVVFLPGTFFLI